MNWLKSACPIQGFYTSRKSLLPTFLKKKEIYIKVVRFIIGPTNCRIMS